MCQPCFASTDEVGHPDVGIVHEGDNVWVIWAHCGVEPGPRGLGLDLVRKERSRVASGRVGAEKQGASGRKDYAPRSGLHIVGGDAPIGTFFPFPQQLLLFGNRARNHLQLCLIARLGLGGYLEAGLYERTPLWALCLANSWRQVHVQKTGVSLCGWG